MAVVNGYATRADLQEHFADTTSTLDVDLLDRAINAASRAVDTYCRRRFWADALVTTRTFRVQSREWVYVDDISTRTGVVVKTGTDGVTFGTTVPATDYILESPNADVVAAGDTVTPHAFVKITAVGEAYFEVEPRFPTMQVTAKFGWSSVPHDVTEATILKAAALFKRKDAPFGVAGFGEFGVVRIGKSDPQVVELLQDYRRHTALVT